MAGRKGERVLATAAVPISEAKARFSELARKAAMGLETIAVNKHGSARLVSLIGTDILTAALDSMKFTVVETEDDELGVVTLAVEEIPVYGEGATRKEAVVALVDAVLDYCDVYQERIELFSHMDSPRTQGLMLKLLRCGNDRDAIRHELGV
jgi:antitoxin (DNA-binding transcriptional repressor) of toxin-antitoxin stability system